MKKNKVVVFDLDDTLYKEIDYLKSAFMLIANKLEPENKSLFKQLFKIYKDDKDVFGFLEKKYNIFSKSDLIEIYRTHKPNIYLSDSHYQMLNNLKDKYFLGLITDGRSLTQRNKLKSLGIENLFDEIVISEEFNSEKPCTKNFEKFHEFKANEYFYIGDNTSKDFVSPNKLGWTTICLLNNGLNIHQQDFKKKMYNPKFKIKDLNEIIKIIE